MNEIFSSDNKMTLFEQTLEMMKNRGAQHAAVPWGCKIRGDLATKQHSDV